VDPTLRRWVTSWRDEDVTEVSCGCRGSLPVEKGDVLRMAVVRRHLALEFAGDEGDRRERRTELVRGGGGEAVERRQVLLAGEHHLGRVERAGEFSRFLGDLERVGAGKGAGRPPHPHCAVDVGGAGLPGPRAAAGGSRRFASTYDRQEVREGGNRRDDHRDGEEDGERVVEAAGEEEERRAAARRRRA
jgi:hypothetical protein